ncbi:MAG: PhnD/SsuA/transferrin family substrate-binding protein, partial [Spirochaetes bacterium]|nr:PhnD/SsuA/transferrin family substrate-binding protein [Spirochaetota bacterium]
MIKKMVVIGLVLVILFSCNKKDKNTESTLDARTTNDSSNSDVVQSGDVLNFGVASFDTDEVLKEIYLPILEYLEEQTGTKFVLNIAPDYNSLKDNLLKNQLQLVNFSPATYADAVKTISDKIQYCITTSRQGELGNRDYYKGVIFT